MANKNKNKNIIFAESIEPLTLHSEVIYSRCFFVYKERFGFDLNRIPPASVNPYGDGTPVTQEDMEHFEYQLKPCSPIMDNLINEHVEMMSVLSVPETHRNEQTELYKKSLRQEALQWEYD